MGLYILLLSPSGKRLTEYFTFKRLMVTWQNGELHFRFIYPFLPLLFPLATFTSSPCIRFSVMYILSTSHITITSHFHIRPLVLSSASPHQTLTALTISSSSHPSPNTGYQILYHTILSHPRLIFF